MKNGLKIKNLKRRNNLLDIFGKIMKCVNKQKKKPLSRKRKYFFLFFELSLLSQSAEAKTYAGHVRTHCFQKP